jgi:hypothetical protein
MAMDKVWLYNPTTEGHFLCPADAVESWRELGWVPAEAPPEEPNPAVVERIAWEQELAAGAVIEGDESPGVQTPPVEDDKTTKPSRARTAATDQKE